MLDDGVSVVQPGTSSTVVCNIPVPITEGTIMHREVVSLAHNIIMFFNKSFSILLKLYPS